MTCCNPVFYCYDVIPFRTDIITQDTVINTTSPIFILAAPASGASWLSAALGQHPQAYAGPDINVLGVKNIRHFWEETDGIRRYQRHGLLRLIAELYTGEQSINAIHMAKRWLFRRVSGILIYQEILERITPFRFIDSSPQLSQNAETLAQTALLFPQAFYIHLVRNPWTQVQTLLHTAQGLYLTWGEPWRTLPEDETQAILDILAPWLHKNRLISQFLETIPTAQQIRIRSEDFFTNPEATLQRLCQRLGWDFSSDCLHPERSPFASWGPANANLGYEADFLAQPRFLPPVTQPLMSISPHWPLPWQQNAQKIHPEIIELARQLGYRLAKPGELPMPESTPPITPETVQAQATQLLADQTPLPPHHSSTDAELAAYRQDLEYRIAMLKAFYEEAQQELAQLPPPASTTPTTDIFAHDPLTRSPVSSST